MTKKILRSLLSLSIVGAAAGVGFLDAPVAEAAQATSNLTVSATVATNCTITTSPVAFGAYDPIGANAAAPLNAQGSVTVTCTQGDSAVKIGLTQGANPAAASTAATPLRRMANAALDKLSYFLYTDAARTDVWGQNASAFDVPTTTGAAQPFTIYGQIAAAQNVPIGSYADTVVATVTF